MNRTLVVLVLAAIIASPLAARPAADRETLFQTSTIDALMDGIYDGNYTLGELKKHGDFGIGTFNELNGEMLVLDGKCYQITSDGNAHLMSDSAKTPFAAVTYFDNDQTQIISQEPDFASLTQLIDKIIPSANLFYAIRIEGEFLYAKTRSVPKQSRPYRKLIDIVSKQPTFEFSNVKGTIVGFRCPYFVKGVNVPGYHFHLITQNKTQGGHLLDCRIKSGTITLDITQDFKLSLPTNKEFLDSNFQKTDDKALEKVEKDH